MGNDTAANLVELFPIELDGMQKVCHGNLRPLFGECCILAAGHIVARIHGRSFTRNMRRTGRAARQLKDQFHRATGGPQYIPR